MADAVIRATDSIGNHIDITIDVSEGDITAPVLSGISVNPGETDAVLSWSTNTGEGNRYFMVDQNASRTAAQVEAGGGADSGSATVTTSGAQTDITATGLTDDTAYYFHLVHKDVAGNYSTVSSTSFTTDAAATHPFTTLGTFSNQSVSVSGQAMDSGEGMPDAYSAGLYLVSIMTDHASDSNRTISSCKIDNTAATQRASSSNSTNLKLVTDQWSAIIAGGGGGGVNPVPSANLTLMGGAIIKIPDGYTLVDSFDEYDEANLDTASGDWAIVSWRAAAAATYTKPAGAIDIASYTLDSDAEKGGVFVIEATGSTIATGAFLSGSNVRVAATAWRPPA